MTRFAYDKINENTVMAIDETGPVGVIVQIAEDNYMAAGKSYRRRRRAARALQKAARKIGKKR